MKHTYLICFASFAVIGAHLQAANLTGEGYIYITQPSSAWTPPSGIYDTPRFIWYPDKAALRFGDLSSGSATYWNDASIGIYSFAAGLDTLADDYSFAFGHNSSATGPHSFVFGQGSTADSYSFVLGSGSVATGGSYVFGDLAYAADLSVAAGFYTYASSSGSTALGWAAYTGDHSASALGHEAGAIGMASTAIGYMSYAIPDYSVAVGPSAATQSFGSVALGMNTLSKRMNGSNASPGTAQADDPVFMVSQAELGTEPGDTATANALTIYRNGAAHFNGVVRVKAGGDISMGGYTTQPTGVSFP